MSKSIYVNANLNSNYDTFANWLLKTNQIIFDMGASVVTTNSSAVPDVTTGNGYVNGFFGSNTMYVFTALHGGTPTSLAALNVTSSFAVSNISNFYANVSITGTANVSVNLHSVGIVSNNISVNNNLIVTNTATLNTATAVTANITTANIATLGVTGVATSVSLNVTNIANLNNANVVSANITTLGVTGLANFVNASIGTGTSNVQANTTQITISNPSSTATINATTFSGTAANATNLNSQPAAFYTNASNMTTGTLPWARLNAGTVNTSGAFTFGGIQTFNANLIVNAANYILIGNATVNTSANQTSVLVSNSVTNTNINPGVVTFGGGATINNTIYTGTANNANALGGYIANTSSPSDGFVLAYNQSENRIKWVNPSGISTALTSNSVVANASLQAGSNGSVYALTVEGNTTSTNVVVQANNISLAVDSGSVRLNSNALVTNSLLIGNTGANVTVTTSTVTIQNSTTSAVLTPNSFSRQANGATNFGPEGSGVTLTTLQSQITGNAATAYSNAVANSSNATNITSGTLNAARLPAGIVNTSGSFTYTGTQTYDSTVTFNANTRVEGNTTSVFIVGNTTSNMTSNSTTISFNGVAVINSTAFSRQANGATNFGPEGSGITLTTLQSQFTSNDATTYSNATAFASNATNITTGTLAAGRLPSTIVNTSASFTLAGGMTFDGTVRFNANVGINRAPGTDNSRFNVLFPTTVNATDVLYIQKTRDSANAARYAFTDVGGLTTDSNGGAFWRGFHLAAPGITDGAAVAQFPRFAIAAETETLTNPSTRRWILEAGNDSATSRYSIVMRTAGADRFVIDGGGNAALGWSTTSVGALSVSGPSVGSTAGNLGIVSRLRSSTGNASGIDILSIRNSAGSDWTTAGQRLQAFTDSTFQAYMQFNGNNNLEGLSFGTGSNTTDRNTIPERMRIVSNGHVGINTTSPFSILHALKTSGSGGSVAATGTTDGTTIARFGAGVVGMDMGVVDSGPAYIQTRNVGDFATKYSLFLNPTGGNVGIGVSDPTTNLDVNGAIRSRDAFAFVARRSASWAWSTILGGGSATTSGYYAVYNPSDVRQAFVGYWDGSGAGNFVAAQTDGATQMTFGTNGTTRLTFDGSTGQATFANKVLVNGIFEWNGSASGIFEIKQENVSGSTAAAARTLQVFQNTNGQDAFMTFHTNSDFAFHFGLDTTTNDLFVGGWSFGAVKYRVWHAGNDGSGSGLDADLLDGLDSTAFSRLGVAQTYTANKTFGAGLFETAVDLGAGSAINLNSGTYYYKTISGATSFTVSNVPASGTVASFTLELINGGSAAITWMTGTRWAGGTAPSLTASGRDILVFTTRDGGTIWYGSAAVLNAV